MPNRRLSALLFLSAYSPVFLLLGLRAYDRACAIVILSLILLGLAAAGIVVFLLVAHRSQKQRMTVVTVEQRDGDLAGFLVAYLLPFVGVLASDWRDVLAISLFICFIGLVYVNSRMVYVNPLLALFGYHLILIRATTDPEGRPAEALSPQFLVTKRAWLRPGDTFTARPITDEALLTLAKDDTDAPKSSGRASGAR
jgi:hypothetical protein